MKMKRYKPGGKNGITSTDGRESISVATRIRTRCDVVEAVSSLVQPGIEENKWGPAIQNSVVIEQRDYPCHRLDRCLRMDDAEWKNRE